MTPGDAVDQSFEHSLTVGELPVDQGPGIAGFLRDELHGRRLVAALQDQPLGRIEQKFLGLVGGVSAPGRPAAGSAWQWR